MLANIKSHNFYVTFDVTQLSYLKSTLQYFNLQNRPMGYSEIHPVVPFSNDGESRSWKYGTSKKDQIQTCKFMLPTVNTLC